MLVVPSRGYMRLTQAGSHVLAQQQQLTFTQVRYFGPKKRGRKKKNPDTGLTDTSDNEAEEAEPEVKATATPSETQKSAASTPSEAVNLGAEHSQPWDLGDIKRIDSTPDHASPSKEDTIEGRYASVLFTSASQQEALYDVYDDMKYIAELYQNSESFQLFTANSGVGKKEIDAFNTGI